MILAVGATDSSGGAGLAQDRRTAEALGCGLRSAVTGITVQGAEGVSDIFPAPPFILRNQIETHLTEDSPAAVKIGALCEASQIDLIAGMIHERRLRKQKFTVIADPVFSPSRGRAFLEDDGISAYSGLLPVLDIITPNVHELALLSGRKVLNPRDAEYAAAELAEKYRISVIVTGGHFDDPGITELVVTPGIVHRYSKPRIKLKHTRGTGCCLATALSVYLSGGMSLFDAFGFATEFVTEFASKRTV